MFLVAWGIYKLFQFSYCFPNNLSPGTDVFYVFIAVLVMLHDPLLQLIIGNRTHELRIPVKFTNGAHVYILHFNRIGFQSTNISGV